MADFRANGNEPSGSAKRRSENGVWRQKYEAEVANALDILGNEEKPR
jgi:hypothetical protein